MSTAPAKSLRFDRSRRLSGKLAFARVYEGKKRIRFPLVSFRAPNDLKHSRWGISISRRVGIAPKRNRIKRLLRESIRLLQRELMSGTDFILVVRPHEPLTLGEYQKLIRELCAG